MSILFSMFVVTQAMNFGVNNVVLSKLQKMQIQFDNIGQAHQNYLKKIIFYDQGFKVVRGVSNLDRLW